MTISRREFLQWTSAAAGATAVGGCAGVGGSAGKVVVIGAGYGGATAAKYIKLWAPDIDVTIIERGSEFSQDTDPRYADIGGGPLTECLADVVARFVPYYEKVIVPDLRAGKTVLVAAHGNSLRALVKYLDGMSDADVVGLNIPTGVPLRYDLDGDLKPKVAGGTYLDPAAAAAGAAAVANQGAK